MKKGIHSMNPKKQNKVYGTEIQNDLPKITKFKWICYFFNQQWSKILNYMFYHVLTTIQLNFKISEIKKIKSYASSGIRTHDSWNLRLRNTCAKKTAENVFKFPYFPC